MYTTPLHFPSQKIPTSKKDEKWYKECIDGAESLAILKADGSFGYHHKMQVWENLDNDIIDESEIEKVFNPMQIEDAVFPAAIKNYPLSVPKIDLLQGEESKRTFDWRVMAKNEDAYSIQADTIKSEIMNIAMEEIQSGSADEKEVEDKIQKIAKYFKYEYKDLNELYATRTLEYLWRQQNLKRKFFYGFRDALVKGREIYRIDDIGGEPALIKADPKNVYFIRKGDSHRIEDADIIIEASYEPVGAVIDEFHKYLKPADIDELEGGTSRLSQKSGDGILNHQNPFPILASGDMGSVASSGDPALKAIGAYNLPFDYEGNVRVLRVRWMGRKKIGILTSFHPITGDEVESYVSEYYKVKEELGESVRWIWVNEAYEGTRLANSIYIKMQPRQIQMRHYDNPSKCWLGYVGTDYGKSLMSRMEPLQYLYNVYMRRVELFYARYHGPMFEWDLSKKPDEWSEDMWMYYGDVLGKLVIDNFNEGKKGAATGKIAGANNNTSGRAIDASSSNYVQQLLAMLQYIETQMGEIAGVSKQRQGQIDNRETLGGVERAVTQSSHITEKWFFIHDETKKRALLALLDTAKQIWKNKKSKKLSFIMDDMSRITMDINGEDFAATEHDIFITDSGDDLKIRNTIEQLSHAYVQNGGSMTLPIKVLRSDSITAMGKIIEEEEEKMFQREQQAEDKKLQAEQVMQQATLEDNQANRDLEYYKINTEANTKLQVAGMQPGEDNPAEEEKLELQRKKQEDEVALKDRDLNLKKQQHNETIRHNKASEAISKIKKQTTSK